MRHTKLVFTANFTVCSFVRDNNGIINLSEISLFYPIGHRLTILNQIRNTFGSLAPLSLLHLTAIVQLMNSVGTCLRLREFPSLGVWFFIAPGISQLAQCGQLGDLPELPPSDEQRLQKAASLLQQRLILRQWLTKYELQHYYPR